MLLVERYLLAFAHREKGKLLTHQQVFVKTSSVGGSTTFVSRLFQILEYQEKFLPANTIFFLVASKL